MGSCAEGCWALDSTSTPGSPVVGFALANQRAGRQQHRAAASTEYEVHRRQSGVDGGARAAAVDDADDKTGATRCSGGCRVQRAARCG
jgi:hypothetical protein